MNPGHGGERDQSTDKSHEHVPLRIPNVALSAEECIGARTEKQSSPPFDEFVKRTDRHADADDDKKEPFTLTQRTPAQKDFAGENRGNEPLSEMANSIVMIASKAEEMFHPKTERNFRVCIMAANHKNQCVNKKKPVNQRR